MSTLFTFTDTPLKMNKPCTAKDDYEVTILEAPSSPSSSSTTSSSSTSTTSDQRRDPGHNAIRHLPVPSLTDDELWEPWFSFPSRPQMTLNRWAEGNKSQLDMFNHHLPSSPPISLYPLFLTKCRSTLTSLKILVLGSILLLRGVDHGPHMGRILFGRIIGDRYNDLMAFKSNSTKGLGSGGGSSLNLHEDEDIIRRSVEGARGLQSRGNEFFAQGKYEASLEHYGMAITNLIPWDSASLSPEISQRTGFEEIEQSLMLSIALTSVRISQILPVEYKSHLTVPGSRLHRLSKASCDYILYSPCSTQNNLREWSKDEELAWRLSRLASDIADIQGNDDEMEEEKSKRGVREVRYDFERSNRR